MAEYPQYFSDLVNDVTEDYVQAAPHAESFAHVEARCRDFVAEISKKIPRRKDWRSDPRLYGAVFCH